MAWRDRTGRPAVGLNPRRVLIVAAVFVIAYFGIAIVGNAVNRHQLARDQQTLRRDIASLEAQQRRLEALRAYMQSDEFIERAARDEGLIRPGDTPVVVAAPTPAASSGTSPAGPWWERYFGAADR